MELHHIGKHCSLTTCKKLDYLPTNCTYCQKDYCEDHSNPEKHNCESNHIIKDVKVPVCPICNQPIPVKKGEIPDTKVNEHINSGCKIKEKKIEICNAKSCKTKITQVFHQCKSCQRKYCLNHRLPEEHECQLIDTKNNYNYKSNNLYNNNNNNNNNNNKLKSEKKKNKCIIC
ncbi:hypothetical protein K502DRAFT_70894 [Neoconidiobolus thromboides FSU 785]|nr:hypothetical protein K502DRAFT_70894 [Neoconidiobolus thromboides FSU 785]